MGKSRKKGFALVLSAGTLWGVSGTVAQYLFHRQGFSPEWLVVFRLLTAGAFLLAITAAREPGKVLSIWKNKSDAIGLIVFSIFGMLAVQYTFFATIDYSNAATATVLQYLAPVMIAVYLSARMKRPPTARELAAVILALIGTVLLVTKGNLNSLSISGLALFWGLISAVALATYTLQPGKLLAKWGSVLVTGWGMLIGGICFSFVHAPWQFEGSWTAGSFIAVAFVVAFGTVIAFYCYLESLSYLSPSETSVLASIEPLSAAAVSVLWLHVPFGLEEWAGTLCIISTIVILSQKKKEKLATAEGLTKAG